MKIGKSLYKEIEYYISLFASVQKQIQYEQKLYVHSPIGRRLCRMLHNNIYMPLRSGLYENWK